MSYKIVLLAVAVFGYQVNAQVGGFIRPFATGFANGFSEMARPFVQLGQSAMAPVSEYISAQRYPYISQMMNYPSKVVPQAQAAAYEGFDAISSGMPGVNYVQAVRPPVMRPQTQYYQVSGQASVKPPRPSPIEQTAQINRPSSLLIKPQVELPKPEKLPETPLDEGFDAISSGMPGVNYVQAARPPVMRPQTEYYQVSGQVSGQASVKPPRPSPVQQTAQINRPSSLLIKPQVELPKPEKLPETPLDAGFEGPSVKVQMKY